MKLVDQIKFEEGCRLHSYYCTAGYKTIGYGHNMDKNPYAPDGSKIPDMITQGLADDLLSHDIGNIMSELRGKWPRINEFDPARRDAFFNMAFQLGVNGFMRFERMRAAALARNWSLAADEAKNSNWANQTPERAKRIVNQIKTGKYYSP